MAHPETNELVLEAGRSSRHYWRDLWRYRELFYFLTWRDILVRYKQTSIGVAWAVIRPFLTMVILTIVFGRIARVPAPGSVPYPLLVMAGMLPWQFFSSALSESSNSLIGSANLISKVYFPRLIIPVGSVITSFVDFAITLVLMALMMVWYQWVPDWRIVFLPLFVLLTFATAFGAGLILCTLNVKYRDFRYVIPFIVQFGLYVSPVGFDSSMIPERWSWLYALNPMVGIIDGFRWSLLAGQSHPSALSLGTTVAMTLLMGWVGIWYFRRMERTFADTI